MPGCEAAQVQQALAEAPRGPREGGVGIWWAAWRGHSRAIGATPNCHVLPLTPHQPQSASRVPQGSPEGPRHPSLPGILDAQACGCHITS